MLFKNSSLIGCIAYRLWEKLNILKLSGAHLCTTTLTCLKFNMPKFQQSEGCKRVSDWSLITQVPLIVSGNGKTVSFSSAESSTEITINHVYEYAFSGQLCTFVFYCYYCNKQKKSWLLQMFVKESDGRGGKAAPGTLRFFPCSSWLPAPAHTIFFKMQGTKC